MEKLVIRLAVFEKSADHRVQKTWAASRRSLMEFHIRREVREEYGLAAPLFSLRGNVVLPDLRQCRELAAKFNAKVDPAHPERFIRAGHLYAMGLIDEILHYVVALYREQIQPDAFDTALGRLESSLGDGKTAALLTVFNGQFPPRPVYAGESSIEAYLGSSDEGESCRALSLEETMLLSLANLNPAFSPFKFLFDDGDLSEQTVYPQAIEELKTHFAELPPFGPGGQSLWDMLRAPALAAPESLLGQLEYMRKHWGLLIARFMSRILISLDVIHEEEKPRFFGPGPMEALSYGGLDEYERFSPDQEWMPRTVLMAKSTLVWLFQLSQKHGREITRLDQIPDEELDELARRGFTGLWLIGLWERSNASRTIKQWTGNPEAAASAYSLYDYDIAGELGGWGALADLRERCFRRGIRLGSDMVPNHTGIDSRWIMEHPERFLQLSYPPFPGYNYTCGNLSGRDDVSVQIEEHYFTRTDAAVVFKRIDNRTGEVRYIYHGNDGTSMPWNDTAQIDFLNPEAREAVIQTIVGVCKQFSIVRFDAAMTLAKRHIQRLWYPEPGRGGDIASRAEHGLSNDEFNRRIPHEFWREVVDRCAAEAPNTLLLAEAFWMMEGYFVRTLGMHRVYNSAFMNMLKNEDNAKYRATIKNTLEFDPEILKRFVNFMNNPDEETAVAQFGKGDKYFGVCTLLVTMPGLPMFGHGQIEGFEEKYGMEYRRSYRDEKPDQYLVERHEREIFPLVKRRALFSGSAAFRLYDLFTADGSVNEHVFAYSNRHWDDRALIFYNNSYSETSGWIHRSSPAIPQEDGGYRQDTLSEALSIHGEGRYFTLLREQRSGLWYIRSSREISEKGLYVYLKGYEAQVFLDIYEMEDGPGGRWAKLNHELNGRGVPDPDAAIQDLCLGELYYRLAGLVKPETVAAIHGFFTRTGTAAAEAFIASQREPVRAFIETAGRFIGGAEGRYDPFVSAGRGPALPPERIVDEWGAFLAALLDIAAYSGPVESVAGAPVVAGAPGAEGLAGTKAAAGSGGKKSPAEPYLAGFAAEMRDRPCVIAAALGYGILALLRSIIGRGASGTEAARLGFDHWSLDRKLREQYRKLGVPEDEGRRLTALMKAVLSRTVPEDRKPCETGSPAKPGLLAAAIIEENYEAEDFRALLGINFFDDAAWFNKEGFEAALFYGSLFFLLESDAAFEEYGGGKKPVKARAGKTKAAGEGAGTGAPSLFRQERAALVAELAAALSRAEKVSGYRMDGLLDALAGGNGGKPGGKTTGKKVN
ncbi:MAG: alpha-amylase [Treponema sp.]|jgi:glycosidase|nr:alpha-amylase [Treponema sp.]